MPASKHFKTFYAVSVAFQLGFLIAGSILGFILLGIIADYYFKTSPIFLILGTGIGFVATIFETYHMLAPLMSDSSHAADSSRR